MARPSRIPAAVLALLRGRDRHAWTIEQLRKALAKRQTPAEFSALFRALERLVAAGALDKVTIGDAAARYEPHGAHHDHVRCTRCGKLVAVPCLATRLDIARLERETGFELGAHAIVISGVCEDCRRSSLDALSRHD